MNTDTSLNKTFISRNELLNVQIETHADFFENYEPQQGFDEILRQKSQQKSQQKSEQKLKTTRLEMAKMAAWSLVQKIPCIKGGDGFLEKYLFLQFWAWNLF